MGENKSFHVKCRVFFLSYLNLNMQAPTKYSNPHIRLLLSPISAITCAILQQFDVKVLKGDDDRQITIMNNERLVSCIGFRGHGLQRMMYVAILSMLSYGMWRRLFQTIHFIYKKHCYFYFQFYLTERQKKQWLRIIRFSKAKINVSVWSFWSMKDCWIKVVILRCRKDYTEK
jgi:hypothetical protein